MGGRWAVAEYRHDRGSFNSHRHKIADVRRRCHLPLSQVDEVENEDIPTENNVARPIQSYNLMSGNGKAYYCPKIMSVWPEFHMNTCVHYKFSTHDTLIICNKYKQNP